MIICIESYCREGIILAILLRGKAAHGRLGYY